MTENLMTHTPNEAVMKGDITITWDILIITDKKLKCNKTNILIYDSVTRVCAIIDASIPIYTHIIRKVAVKLIKYKELEIELKNVGI